MASGASPAKGSGFAAGTPPNRKFKGVVTVLLCCTIWPAGIAGDTGPNPTPYITMVSPGWAGRVFTPAIEPVGSASDPSESIAQTYWAPLRFVRAGAYSPGSSGLTVTVSDKLSPR